MLIKTITPLSPENPVNGKYRERRREREKAVPIIHYYVVLLDWEYKIRIIQKGDANEKHEHMRSNTVIR